MTKAQVRRLLATDVAFMERMILALQRRQTEDEKADRTTRHDNDRGWNAADAKLGSYLAWWICKTDHRPEGQRLSGEWVVKARVMMAKYAGQCERICNDQIARRRRYA